MTLLSHLQIILLFDQLCLSEQVMLYHSHQTERLGHVLILKKKEKKGGERDGRGRKGGREERMGERRGREDGR